MCVHVLVDGPRCSLKSDSVLTSSRKHLSLFTKTVKELYGFSFLVPEGDCLRYQKRESVQGRSGYKGENLALISEASSVIRAALITESN